MWKLLKTLNTRLVLAIPAAMALGLAWGLATDAAPLKVLIAPLTFLMVYPMMVTLNVREVLRVKDWKLQAMTQVVNFALVPFAAYALGMIFFRDQPFMALGLLLAGLVPTSGMTISWTGLAGGNVPAAVRMTVIGLTLGALATPVYVQALMGAAIQMDVAAVARQIGLIVFLPMALGWATRAWLVRRVGKRTFGERWAPRFPGLSVVGVLGIVFTAMALKARAVASAPEVVLFLLVPLALLYAFNFGLSSLLGRLLLPRGDAIALVYGSVMRNLSIALAIALNAFGERGADAALVIAAAYVVQVQSAAWYVRFTDRIFGEQCETAPACEAQKA
ncbi:arsenic resistance protein [Desulfocurvus sp. DL9XJH121]